MKIYLNARKILLPLIIVLPLFISTIVLAAEAPEKSLEVTYPSVIGEAPTTVGTSLPDYVVYIFNFAVWGSGFIALIVIVIAGFRYLTSAGNPQTMQDSKNQITAALLGVLILASTFLILNTINPDLTTFNLPGVPYTIPKLNPGVWVCKSNVPFEETWNKTQNPPENADKNFLDDVEKAIQQIKQQCQLVVTQGKFDNDFNDKVKYVFIASIASSMPIPVPGSSIFVKIQYGAILFEEAKFNGRAVMFYGDGHGGTRSSGVVSWTVPSDMQPSSIRPFILNQKSDSSSYIDLYQQISFNRDSNTAKTQHLTSGGSPALSHAINLPTPNGGSLPEIGSLKIEGHLIAVFFPETTSSWTSDTQIDVYTESDSDLNNNLMERWRNNCREIRPGFQRPRDYPCAGEVVTVNGSIF